jgi:pimeloyl-ACP methyl ester carboxylesterase
VVAAGACSGGGDDDGEDSAPSTTAAPLFESTFEDGPCPEELDLGEVPEEDLARVTCGTVAVPERHADPDGPMIELAVAVIEPTIEGPSPDPLVLLQGGPGYGYLSALPFLLEEPVVEDRATVLFDPRGTGFSEPSLACPEIADTRVDLLSLDADDPAARQLQHDAVRACHERLEGDGVDLAAYSYTEIAADVGVLRQALGYEAWNVYGISNGGRMALEVVRRHPEGVRSLVLDAALPPQGNFWGEVWPHARLAFDALFAGCAADPACAGAYPELEATAWGLVERLADEPVVVDTEDDVTGDPVSVRIDDEVVLTALRESLYDRSLIPILPQYIQLLGDGEGFADVAGLVASGTTAPDAFFSHGMSLSVSCQEEVAFLEEGFFDEQAAELPELASVIEEPTILDDCEVWDVGRADPSIDEPVDSDVPALVLVGEYDPVHPLRSSQAIADGLSNSQLFEVPGLGHGTVRLHECPLAVMQAFLVDPAAPVDAGCIGTMPPPAWLVP